LKKPRLKTGVFLWIENKKAGHGDVNTAPLLTLALKYGESLKAEYQPLKPPCGAITHRRGC